MTERSVKNNIMAPRSEQENENIRNKRTTEIIMVALELFATKGYHSTSISKIAQQAGISKGLMYNYFNSKEDLLKEVVLFSYKKASDTLLEKMQAEIQHKSLKDAIKTVIELFFEMMTENAHIWKLSISLSMQVTDMPDIQTIMSKIFSEAFQRIAFLLNPENPEIVEAEARIIAATLDGIALHYYVIGESYDLDTVKNKLIENLTNKF